MPKVSGSFVNQKDTKTHAFHGVSALGLNPAKLSKYLKLSFEKNDSGFDIFIKNMANHTLTPHPLRVSILNVKILRKSKTISLGSHTFSKIIGTNSKASMPWLATDIIKDNSIKAFEKRKISFNEGLQKDDILVVEFGYYLIKPKIAKKLNIKEKNLTKFIVLKREKFPI